MSIRDSTKMAFHWLFINLFLEKFLQLLFVCNAELQTEHNGHLTFQCVIDCWDTHLDTGMPGAILSCSVIATHKSSSVTKKQVEGNI